MKINPNDIQELQKYLDILSKLENKKVRTSDIHENNYEPFINDILIFNYVSDKCDIYDTFPVLICTGFTYNKRSNRIFLKGINLNYVSSNVRFEMVKLLDDIKKRLKIIESKKDSIETDLEIQYNAYEVFKDRFKEFITTSYKTYDISHIMGLKIIPKNYWNMMIKFPIDTFVQIHNNSKK